MCDFKPGDEVVCVDACGAGGLLRDGSTYTVATVGIIEGCTHWVEYNGAVGVALVGLHFPNIDGNGFVRGSRFRKVDRKTGKLNLTEWLSQPSDFEEPKRAPAKKRERV